VPCDEVALDPDRATPVCAEAYVPFDLAARSIDGKFTVSDGRELPIRLKIRDFALPREASFRCEMNSYGLPDKVSDFYRLQAIAYDHRVHCNILHYSHRTAAPGARKCNLDMMMDLYAPPGDARRMDERRYNDIAPGARQAWWDDFARVYGPYISGSHFKNGHRGPIPAPELYLTFHESWPLNVRAYFNGNPDAYEAFKAKPVYGETFVNVMRDFITTARRQGWTKTSFQVYLNNKGKLDDPELNPWILDEPAAYWDYRALAYYADLVKRAKKPVCPINLNFRIDISRPEFDRGQLYGKADLWVVSGDAFKNYNRTVLDRAELSGERIWTYGSSNNVDDTNRTILAWVLEAYCNGASGVVPWQTVNRDGTAMTKADQLGLFIFAKDPAGKPAVYHSMRLDAYRRAEQDIEYLELLRKKLRFTPGQMRAFVGQYVDLTGKVVKQYEADAGTARFGKLSPEAFRQLREATAMLLE